MTSEITERKVNMIVKDMLPLSLADGTNGIYIPSRKTLTDRLEQQFAEKKAELKRKLANVDVALTTDCRGPFVIGLKLS